MIVTSSNAVLTCPACGSATIRRSRRQNNAELRKMALGTYPFRCIACSNRFWANIWLWSVWKYAKCPKCLSLDLTSWARKSQHIGYGKKLLLTLGAQRHRCPRCRCNFVSFRPRSPHTSLAAAAAAREPVAAPDTTPAPDSQVKI